MSDTLVLEEAIPEKLEPLAERENRRRYYIAYGGRGGAKSWNFARCLVIQAMEEPLRILCAREIQRTIAESVHQLIVDQIKMLGLERWFTITETQITHVDGAVFIFAGLRQQDAHKIKSYEGVDIVWVEEAQVVTKRSWDILIPTIRAEGSEIWVTFNPDLDTDETYKRFVLNTPPNACLMEVNWRDNPWFPDVLNQERLHMQKTDPEEYEHVWEGKPRTTVAGAIYAREVAEMLKTRRVRPVPYDPTLLVHTIWDLGWNDQTSIIFAQSVVSEIRVIDYHEESFMRPDQCARMILNKEYLYGDHWLPHDGQNRLQAAGGKSMQELLTPLLGKKPKVIKRPQSVEDPIRAARVIFPRVYIDEDKCERLVECLRRFRRSIPENTGEPGPPVKDEFRHGADAFGGLAQIAHKLHNDRMKRMPKTEPYRQAVDGVM